MKFFYALVAVIALLSPFVSGVATAATKAGPAATPSAAPHVDPKIAAKAKEWFFRFRSGEIDRSQFNDVVKSELTDAMISQESARLKKLGKLVSFRFVSSGPVGAVAIGYYFALTFTSGDKVVEAIAFDGDGKIAGIDFRIFVPKS